MGLIDHEQMDDLKDTIRQHFTPFMQGNHARQDVITHLQDIDDPIAARIQHHLERVLDRLDRNYQRQMMAAFGRFALAYAFPTERGAIRSRVRDAMWTASARLVESRLAQRDVVQHVRASEDPLLARLNHHLERLLGRVDDRGTRRVLAAFGRFALWLALVDVAYRDQSVWLLHELWDDDAFAEAIDEARIPEPRGWEDNRDRVVWFLSEVWQDPRFAAAVKTADVKPAAEWYANLHYYAEEETVRAQGDDPRDTGLGTESFFHMGEKRKRLEQHQYKQQADEREEGNG